MEEIYLEYHADMKNYFEAAKYFTKSKIKRNIFDRIMEIVVLLIGIFMFTIGDFILGMIFVIFSLLFILRIFEKGVTYLYFKIYISKMGIQKLFISHDKMRYKREDISSEIEWSYYKGFIETPNTVLLLYGKRYYSVIPKAAFSEGELKKFISLLQEIFPA